MIASDQCFCLTPLPQCSEEITLLHYAFNIYKEQYMIHLNAFMRFGSRNVKKFVHDISESLVADVQEDNATKINGVICQINQYITDLTSGALSQELLDDCANSYLDWMRKAINDPLMSLPRQITVLKGTFERIKKLGENIMIDEKGFSEYATRVLKIILPQILDEFEAKQKNDLVECKQFCKDMLEIATDPLNDDNSLIVRNINHFLLDKL